MTAIAGSAWEEPPAEPQELALADLLDRALDRVFQGQVPSARSLLAGVPGLVEQGERLVDALVAILGPGRALREQARLLETDLLARDPVP